MEEKNDKKRGRGRPPKKPIDNVTRLALTVLGYALEQRFVEENVIENSIGELISKSRYTDLDKKIKRFNDSKRKLSRYETEEFKLSLDFWKNFLKVIKGENDCDWPRERTLDKFVQYTFTDEDDEILGLTWRDYLSIFNQYKDSYSVVYFEPEHIKVDKLTPEQYFIVGWVPQHFYLMQYKGNYTFEIKIAGDGMVHKKGDLIRATRFYVHPAILEFSQGNKTYKVPAYAPPEIAFDPPIEEYL